MARLELLTILYSLQALLKTGHTEDAEEVIRKVIEEAEKSKP